MATVPFLRLCRVSPCLCRCDSPNVCALASLPLSLLLPAIHSVSLCWVYHSFCLWWAYLSAVPSLSFSLLWLSIHSLCLWWAYLCAVPNVSFSVPWRVTHSIGLCRACHTLCCCESPNVCVCGELVISCAIASPPFCAAASLSLVLWLAVSDGYQFVLEQIVQMRLRVHVFWIGEHLSDVVRRMSAAGR